MNNLTCDICGYTHPKPDRWAIVIECADGVLRCKVCRGDGKFTSARTLVAAVAALPLDNDRREDAISACRMETEHE